ncbi:MAG: hypothetical protein JJ900_15030 [Rhodospirillales bacterium]|nr:hypothetical protein [Rhodospirillales bacterium]MBO6788160.1 hypothetical protein [Rhodospirillales bacterium]
MNGKDAFEYWMKNVQAVDLGGRDVMDPARSGKSVGEIVRGAGGGLEFDTEPARYYKLLRELAPGGGK